MDRLGSFSTETSLRQDQSDIQMNTVSIQTEIFDVNAEFINVSPNVILVQNRKEIIPVQQPVTYLPNNLYTNINISTMPTLTQSYPVGNMGMWSFYLPSNC
jgi:hypothetical protein